MTNVISIYADGGVIGRNPSPKGGTWCWLQVDDHDDRGHYHCGVVTPADMDLPTISNNLTEFLAVLIGMESLPFGWAGTIYTDSFVTLARTELDRRPSKYNGIPAPLVERLRKEQLRLGAYKMILLGGHPTQADLARGCRDGEGGLPVSKHNVFCDYQCSLLAKAFVAPLLSKCADQPST